MSINETSLLQRTLGIIKPDGVASGCIGKIITLIEAQDITLIDLKMKHLQQQQAETFYQEHTHRSFFQDLIAYVRSGPVVLMLLQGYGVIDKYRDLMGNTDPKKAREGTIRHLWGVDLSANVVHGSDSFASAKREISFFFG